MGIPIGVRVPDSSWFVSRSIWRNGSPNGSNRNTLIRQPPLGGLLRPGMVSAVVNRAAEAGETLSGRPAGYLVKRRLYPAKSLANIESTGISRSGAGGD